MTKTRVTAYPYKRIRSSACLWDELEILYPEDANFENLSEKWDYDVDLEIKVSVELSERMLSADQLAGLDEIKLAVDVHCPVTMWRNYMVAVPEASAEIGTRRYSVIVQIPGCMVSERLDIRPYLIAPTLVPFFREPISQVIMSEGPSKSLILENSLAYFPTSILSFSEANWASAPWRFELTAGTLEDLYANCSRLYVNSDKKVSEVLSNAEDGPLNANAVTAITRDVMLVTLMKLSSDAALREECRESNFTPGSVGKVVSNQVSNLFGRTLDAVVTEFEKNPLPLLMELDASTNYFGKGA